MNKALVLSVAMVASSAFAETLVFAPAEGETTNVTAFLTGTLDVSANPGASGGGTVKIAGHYNNYVGTTANNCGILWPAFFGPDSSYGSLGACTGLTLGQGTLKYTGQAGVISAPVTHTGDANSYSVYEIGEGSELTIAGAFTPGPRIVKTGKGILRFSHEGAGTVTISSSGAAASHYDGTPIFMALNANGDAPVSGGAALTVADGTVVLGKGAYTFSVSKIGAWTAADGEQETSGRLEVRGATLTGLGEILVGDRNGFTTTTPNGRPTSTFAIYDGTVTMPTVWFGRSYYDPPTGKTMNSNPRFEMHGGVASANTQVNFKMGNQKGLLSEFTVDGGSISLTYFIPANKWYSGIVTGDNAGDASSTNVITMAGTAALEFPKILNQANETTFVSLRDSAVFKTAFIDSTSGTMTLDIDGGTLLQRFTSDMALVGSGLARVTLGVRGGIIGSAAVNGLSYVARVEKGVETNPSLVGADGGLTVASERAAGTVRLSAVCSYAGPTTLVRGGLEPTVGGALSSASELRLQGGELRLSDADQTVAALTVGKPDALTAPALTVVRGHPLVVTGAVTSYACALAVRGFADAAGTALAVGDSLDVVVAPLAQKAALETLASKCAMDYGTGSLVGEFGVVESGDTAKLVLTVVDRAQMPDAPAILTLTAASTTLPASVSHLSAIVYDGTAAATVTCAGDVTVDHILVSTSAALTFQGAGTVTLPAGTAAVMSDLWVKGSVVLDVYGNIDLGAGALHPAGGTGSAVYLHEGVVVRCKTLTDGTTACGVYSDGATFRFSTFAMPQVLFGNSQSRLYVGKGGLTLDVSEQDLADDFSDLSLLGCNSYGSISKDPRLSADETDGGVHVVGRGSFANATFSKPRELFFGEGAVNVMGDNYSSTHMLPGSTLRSSSVGGWVAINGFDLGQTDATAPVKLDLPVTATNLPPFYINKGDVADTRLNIYSPVEVGIVEDPSGWKGEATCPPGVYTGIVYQTWIVKNPDVTQFVLPEKYRETRRLSVETGTIKYGVYTLGCMVFTIEDISTPGPVPPPPDPYVDVTVGAGEQLVLDALTTIGSLKLAAGSWAKPSIVGSFGVTNALSLGLLPGEIASARVDGDVTIKSDAVWSVDYDADGKAADLLVVNGKLTVEKGATLDFGRTDANPLPRHFRAPIACATGAIAVPARVAATGTGGLCESMELTVENGVLYASEPKRGLMILVR